MKIQKIEKISDVYLVTLVPNFIERIFGIGLKVEKYKTDGRYFTNFPQKKSFYDSNGKLLSWDDKILEALNNFERKF
jgi:hypothetical protein